MKDVWDPLTDWLPEEMVTETAERLARAPEAFRRRNIAFDARNLIALWQTAWTHDARSRVKALIGDAQPNLSNVVSGPI
jgi:hypothetical protein